MLDTTTENSVKKNVKSIEMAVIALCVITILFVVGLCVMMVWSRYGGASAGESKKGAAPVAASGDGKTEPTVGSNYYHVGGRGGAVAGDRMKWRQY